MFKRWDNREEPSEFERVLELGHLIFIESLLNISQTTRDGTVKLEWIKNKFRKPSELVQKFFFFVPTRLLLVV